MSQGGMGGAAEKEALLDKRVDIWLSVHAGKEGAGPKEGMTEALEDTKKAASDAAAGQSL